MPQQKITILIPKEVRSRLKKNDRLVFAKQVIEFIKERTASGEDVGGSDFPKYNKSYAKKKRVGVNDVDLILSSEMLSSLKMLSERKDRIVVGYDGRKRKLNGKVEGNRLGTYGQPSPIPGKKRDFLGIDDNDRDEIVRKVADGDI